MEKFEFSPPPRPVATTTFHGPNFYQVYKDAEFLKTNANVERLLGQGYELRKKLSTVEPGKTVVIEGMNLGRK